MGKRVVWCIPLAVVLVAGLVRADDESDRKQLIEQIDNLLSGMSDDLGRVAGDSGTSYIEYALRKADSLKEKLSQLDRVKGDDSKARDMVSYYPGYVDKFKDAVNYFRLMKESQRALDGLSSVCTEKTRDLTAALRTFTDAQDPRGIEKVPELGRDAAKVALKQLEIADKKKEQMAYWLDRADDFSESSGRWNDVKNSLLGAEKGVIEYFSNVSAQVRRDEVCGNLSKENRNPLVEEAMRKLVGNKRDIEAMYVEIDQILVDAASYLDGLSGDSSDSDISSADRKFEELKSKYSKLESIQGNDQEARRRVDSGQKLITSALEMTKNLRILKRAQFLTDKAPDACNDTANRLEQIIRGFTDAVDTDGVPELRLRARGFAEPIKAGLAKTDEQHPIMERAQSDALRFDTSEGRWRDVKDKARASTIAIYEYWTRARNAAHKACDELAKGDQNPTVLRAVEFLEKGRSAAETELLQVTADHRKWYEGLKELREWYSQDTRSVRDAFCSLEESPGDSTEGNAYEAAVNQIANRMRDRIAPRWKDLEAEATRIISVADRLTKVKNDKASKSATKLQTETQKTVNSVNNILKSELNGSNDPEIRARMETGKNEHKRIQADSSKCTMSEVTFGSRRVDCIRVDGNNCYVVEIKPNNSKAITKGEKQVEDGIGEIRKLLAGKAKKVELTEKLEVFRSCFDESVREANLKREVRVYEYCPPEGELFKDFVVP